MHWTRYYVVRSTYPPFAALFAVEFFGCVNVFLFNVLRGVAPVYGCHRWNKTLVNSSGYKTVGSSPLLRPNINYSSL